MNCRLLLTSIAALAASPALAQNNSSTSGPASAQSAAKQKYIKDTLAVGSMSLILSRMALPKVNDAHLKQFTRFEIAEQETVADVLNALKTNASPTGSISSPTDAEAMQNLNEAGKATVEKFRGLKAGSAFDRVFIQTEIDAHRLLLGFQETYLKSLGRSRCDQRRQTGASSHQGAPDIARRHAEDGLRRSAAAYERFRPPFPASRPPAPARATFLRVRAASEWRAPAWREHKRVRGNRRRALADR